MTAVFSKGIMNIAYWCYTHFYIYMYSDRYICFSWTYLNKFLENPHIKYSTLVEYNWVRRLVCGKSETGAPSRKDILEFIACKHIIHIAGTRKLKGLSGWRLHFLFKILFVCLEYFSLVGYMLVQMKSIQVLLLSSTELGFYIMLLAGLLLGLKSDLGRKHRYL